MSYDVDHDRYYENRLDDYSSTNSKNFINLEKNELNEGFKEILRDKIQDLIQQLDRNKKNWQTRDDASIYTGTTGIAYAYYYFGSRFQNESYTNRAVELIDHFERSKIGKRDITFLTGEAGRLALGAVIHNARNDATRSKLMISKLVSLSDCAVSHSYDELLYGRAGYLYALLFVNKHVLPAPIDDEIIKKIIKCILTSGRSYSASTSSRSPLMYSWHDTEYLGGAHGLAGILYILLQAREYLTDAELKNDIQPSLEYLMSLRFPSGNFPSSVGKRTDKLVHWCHGAPSMSMLFILAHEVFNDQRYLEVAKDCAEVVWARGLLKKGCSICHGVSGNAYTFLCLYQKTQDLKYLYRACKFAEWCFNYENQQNRVPDRPFSLFEGLAGIIYFLVDLTDASSSKFPGYTL